jgi:hypothetical protein
VTYSAAFPVTANAAQSTCLACQTQGSDGFVSRLNPAASSGALSLTYSTFLGGGGPHAGGDTAQAVALDQTDNIYVSGITESPDFPISAGALQMRCPGCQMLDEYGFQVASYSAFVAKLNPAAPANGQLVYATLVGGTGQSAANSLAVDLSGDAYLAGSSNAKGFPVTASAYHPHCSNCSGALTNTDAFLTELDPSGEISFIRLTSVGVPGYLGLARPVLSTQ